MVGLTLGGEAEEGVLRFPPALTAPVAVAIGLRLVVAPLLMLALAALIGGVPDAYLLQAATPAAVSSVVVAHAFGLDLKLTASAVAWTTMIVVVAGMIVPSRPVRALVQRVQPRGGARRRRARSPPSAPACWSCSASVTTTTRRPRSGWRASCCGCGSSPTPTAA